MRISSESLDLLPSPGNDCHSSQPPPSQELTAARVPGERVRARAETWTITRVERYPRCTCLDLSGARGRLVLLHPFDRVTPATLSRWTRAPLAVSATVLIDAVLRGTLVDGLAGGSRPLALPRWQFEAARAFEDGAATRVLLADAVGLGKTIQAGLAIAALRADRPSARVLVLAPAGLRDQWTSELEARLGLHGWTADPAGCRIAQSVLPPGVSPWRSHPLVFSSIDYVKQPDVLAAASAAAWDLLVIDEAHHESTACDRRVAADLLARRAARVLLLTATPHAGDDDAYASLCAIGARGRDDAPPLVIRRSREDVGLPSAARLRIVRVPRSAAECAAHDALTAYAAQVADERRSDAPLAMAWLMKRAASSPEALRRSVDRRRALLSSSPDASAASDAWLPFEDEVDERDAADDAAPPALACPGLDNRERELRLLDALSRRASAAARSWRKAERLVRWLAGSHEPAIVFTEYRATLEALLERLPRSVGAAVLHGGLGRAARREALGRFLAGDARLLVATDVAGEGLNLQSAARIVISLEMPWTPSRLQQRIGRVDRIGQERPVRAACLVSREGPEALVAARVAGRASRARAVLPGCDEALDELSLLATALGRHPSGGVHRSPAVSAPAAVHPPDDASALAWLVRAAARRARGSASFPDGRRLPWTRLRPAGPADPLAGSAVVVFLAQSIAPSGRPVAQAAVALAARIAPPARRARASSLLRRLTPHLAPFAARAARDRLAASRVAFERRTRAEIARLRLEEGAAAGASSVQPGLFDRRALTEAAQREADRASRAADRADGIARLESELEGARELPPCPVAALLCW